MNTLKHIFFSGVIILCIIATFLNLINGHYMFALFTTICFILNVHNYGNMIYNWSL